PNAPSSWWHRRCGDEMMMEMIVVVLAGSSGGGARWRLSGSEGGVVMVWMVYQRGDDDGVRVAAVGVDEGGSGGCDVVVAAG
nr:hypothetical protein [Tanacetum cinerariifolium]